MILIVRTNWIQGIKMQSIMQVSLIRIINRSINHEIPTIGEDSVFGENYSGGGGGGGGLDQPGTSMLINESDDSL